MTITSVSMELPERNCPQNLVTAEDRLRYERREQRRPRRKAPQDQYHHIPCSAALGFARTATPKPPNPGKAHRLVRQSMEYYAGGSSCDIHQRQSLTSKSLELEIPCNGEVVASSSSSEGRFLRRKTARSTLGVSRHVHLSSSAAHGSLFGVGGNLSPEYAYCVSEPRRRSVVSPLGVNDRPDWTEQDECLDPQSPSILSKFGPCFRNRKAFGPCTRASKHVGKVTPHEVVGGETAYP